MSNNFVKHNKCLEEFDVEGFKQQLENDFATKEELTEELAKKQGVLTVGDNITIDENNKISANIVTKDYTRLYSDFTVTENKSMTLIESYKNFKEVMLLAKSTSGYYSILYIPTFIINDDINTFTIWCRTSGLTVSVRVLFTSETTASSICENDNVANFCEVVEVYGVDRK